MVCGRALVAGLVVILVAVPPASAQIDNPSVSTPTTLYFHIFDTFNLFPINTQPMDVEHFQVVGSNFPPLPAATGSTPIGGHDYNTIYGFSTAGPVEYDFIENGRPRFHPERGIAADVQIDPAVEPVVYFYLDVRDVFGGNDQPMVLPDFTVRATMRTGDDIGPEGTLDAGDIIMDGSLTAHLASGHAAGPLEGAVAGIPFPDHPTLTPDADGIIEFAIPMTLGTPTIPRSDAYNIRIDWYQLEDELGPDEASMGWLRPVIDPAHLPRLEMAITNPVYIEFIHPQVAAGTLLIHTGVNSPWGTYDVDADNITLSVSGPVQPQQLQRVVAQNQHVHGLHDQAAELTYLWQFRDEDAPSGEYQITMSVPNQAGTAVATGTAGFTIEGRQAFGISDQGDIVQPSVGDGDEGSPVALGAVLLALLGVAMTQWRRRT